MSRQNKQKKKITIRQQVTATHKASVAKLGLKRTRQNLAQRARIGIAAGKEEGSRTPKKGKR